MRSMVVAAFPFSLSPLFFFLSFFLFLSAFLLGLYFSFPLF
jgi:hypothetical protein